MKSCSIQFIIREIKKDKTVLILFVTPVKMTIIKRKTTNDMGRKSKLLVGMENY